MSTRTIVLLLGASIAVATPVSGHLQAAGAQGRVATTPSRSQQRAAFDKYCVSCHNQRLRTQGLDLETIDLAQVSAHSETWEKVVRKLRTGSMPPAGAPRPDPGTYDTLATWLETELDRAAATTPDPGRLPAFHRLNRTEYRNAIRDLLALDYLDINLMLPPDDASYGFDNIADVLWLSPTLLERYLAAAQKISRLAVGNPGTPVESDFYRLPVELSQDDRFDGLPFGTRGGILIRRNIPLDGEYVIKARVPNRPADPHQLEISVDGERVQLMSIGGQGAAPQGGPGQTPEQPTGAGRGLPGGAGIRGPAPDPSLQVRVALKAGPRAIGVTFVKKTSAQTEDLLQPYLRPGRGGRGAPPVLESVTITGPYSANGAEDTPARRRIFKCLPARRGDESVCARRILTSLARRAYRRPATDADLQALLPFYEAGRAEGGFERGIEQALERMLVSPSFLFRIEHDPAGAPGTAARITDLDLASRLSFFLWSSIPDDALLDLAIKGKLRDPTTIEQQVRRMLADPRSESLTSNFAAQWLYLRNLADKAPDPLLFPDFDEGLRNALGRETELFVDSIIRENRRLVELLTADYTFVNERLAKHYGMPNVYGSHFRRVTLADENRRGLLGQGSVLLINSYSTRTSPVQRGKWVLLNILGTPPPEPPPDVPALKIQSTATGKALSMRDAMVQHRANPQCAGCHARMDPIGFAMEQFDAVGRWRDRSEAGTPLDVSGTLPDGSTFEAMAGLRRILVSHPEQFATTVTEKLLTYALGRGVEASDAPAVRGIVREAAGSDYRVSALIVSLVRSTPFQMRKTGDGK